MNKIHIYTDGSSRGNPGPGGWAAIVMNDETETILEVYMAQEDYVTNNQMELKAMLCALQFAESHPDWEFIIYSDSAYVVNAYNDWIQGWARNGWKNSKKQTVENLSLMQALYTYISREFFNAEVKKCKGHEGELGNELADALATNNIKKYKDLCSFWEVTDLSCLEDE